MPGGKRVASVYLDVNLDADDLPRQANAAAREAGDSSGRQFNKSFSENLSGLGNEIKQEIDEGSTRAARAFEDDFRDAVGDVESDLDRLQRSVVDVFSEREGFARYAEGFDSIDDAANELGRGLEELSAEGRLSMEMFERLDEALGDNRDKAVLASQAADALQRSMNELGIEIAEEAAQAEIDQRVHTGLSRVLLANARDAGLTAASAELLAGSLDLAGISADDLGDEIRNMTEYEAIAEAETQRLAREMIEADLAAHGMNRSIKKLGRDSVVTVAELELLERQIKDIRDAELEATLSSAAMGKAVKKADGGGFGKIPTDLDDARVLVVVILAAMTQIAVLGAALAAGIVIAVTAIAALVLGVAAVALGFAGLLSDTDELTAGAQESADAVRAIGDGFAGIKAELANGLFDGIAKPLQAIADETVPVIRDGLIGLAEAARPVLEELATGLSSPAGISSLKTLFAGFKPIFADMLQAVFNIGESLGRVFIGALPATKDFAQFLSDITQRFNDFLGSTEGKAKLGDFFRDGYQVLSQLAPLLGSIGSLFAELVTPKTIAQTEELIGNLTTFMPALADILASIGGIDPFGVIAKALAVLGTSIAPLLGPLQQLGSILGEQITAIFTLLAPIITSLAQALAPVLVLVSQLVASVLPPLLLVLQPILQAFVDFVAVILGALLPAITPLIPLIVEIVQAFIPLGVIVGQLVGQIGGALADVITEIAPLFLDLIQAVLPLVQEILPLLGDLISSTTPLVLELIRALIPMIPPILDIIEAFLPLLQQILPPLIKLLGSVATTITGPLSSALGVLGPVVSGAAGVVRDILVPAFKLVGDTANDLIDFITNVFQGRWGDAFSAIGSLVTDAFNGVVGVVQGVTNGVVDSLNTIIGALNSVIDLANKIPGVDFGKIPTVPKAASGGISEAGGLRQFATGGILQRAEYILAGEAGDEAIVPLNRPLAQVDKSVRRLSAIAQGLPYAGESSSTAGKQVTFAEGAIQVTTSADPVIAASQVFDRFVAAL